MNIDRRRFLSTAAMAPSLARAAASPEPGSKHTFQIGADQFLLDGKPLQILSGEMHYPRVPRSCWRDRMRKARALGLNTISTYVFWNAHEPRPGQFDFSGNLDIRTYLETAQEEGLWVILRPGPYVCAEWDFGGFPAWLLGRWTLGIRSTDPEFLMLAARYLNRVGAELGGLQITRGGPIILCQVENEYGSFGNDHEYMRAIRRIIPDAGFEVPLYTADGAEILERGTLPDLPAVINFGAGSDPAREFALLERFRRTGPRMCGEYWEGWFNHWGETRSTVAAVRVTAGLEWMVSRGISVNIYMFHGGTTFGPMAGANTDAGAGHRYQPDISSYDYDSLLDEAGRPGPKYAAVREVLTKHLSAGHPPLPAPQPAIAIPRFELADRAPLWSLLSDPEPSSHPKSMEALGQAFGLVLYRTRPDGAAAGMLEIREARDYALVYCGGRPMGAVDRRLSETRIPIEVRAGEPLDILVEAMGRVNFGPHSIDDWKGLGDALLDGKLLTGWEQYRLPLDDLSGLRYGSKPVDGPAFHRARIELKETGYTFFDMRGWGKGYLWVNGRNAGRYWSVGPQRSMFIPQEWLREGENEIVVLDLTPQGARSLAAQKEPIWDVAIS